MFKKVKTTDLIDATLDWAVDKAEGRIRPDGGYYCGNYGRVSRWSTDWELSGPLIEREAISIIRCDDNYQNFPGKWLAERGANAYCESTEHQQHEPMIQFSVENSGGRFAKDGPFYGPTPLVAAMRAFVASRLGDEVEVPVELA